VFDNAPLLYTLIRAVGFLGEGIDYTTPGSLFEAMGNVFFSDGTVNDEKGEKFAFDFDLKRGLDSAFARNEFGELPQVLQKLFLSVAHAENYEDMLSKTPSLKGVVNINLKDGLIDSIYCDELNYYDPEKDITRTLKVVAPLLRVTNGELDLSLKKPDPSYYVEGRLTDVSASGKVNLENSQSSKIEMEYDYEFNAKIDLLELVAANGDLTALDEDNFFHFRVIHTCGDSCPAFCKDKYESAKGAILDVAFSPKDFGSYNIYISLGARAFLGSRVVSQWTNIEGLIRNQIPEYILAVISADTLIGQSFATIESDDGKGGKTFIEEILMSLIYSDSSLSVPIAKILQIAGIDDITSSRIMSIFQSEDYYIDTVKIEQNYLRWSVNDYDVKRSSIHLYGNDVSGTKQYTAGLMNRTPALNYEYKGGSVIVGDGERLALGIYNDLYEDGVLFDAQTPICGAEVDDIVGSTVKATAEDVYGDYFDCELYISGHSQIDPLRTGWQEIELYCIPMGRGYLENKLWETIRAQSWSKWLRLSVKTYIYIDELEDVEFIRPENRDYKQGERFLSSNEATPETVTAKLTYAGGKIKNRTVRATNTQDLFIYDYLGNKYVRSAEDTMLNFYLFGRYCGVKINVMPAKDKKLTLTSEELTLELSEAGYSTQLRIAAMTWTLADGSVTEARLPLEYLSINGYSIDSSNDYFYLNPTLSSTSIVFKRTGRYTLSYACDGLTSEAILYISPKAPQTEMSEYSINGATDLKDYYFVGYTYNFDAAIVNTYHGYEGKTAKIDLQVRRGYVNSSGNLVYGAIENPQDYYVIQDTMVNNDSVDLPYTIDLPPTIYNSIPLRVKINFLKSGYYELRLNLDGKSCAFNINVDLFEE
ncbi:MAG: hypothetical protein K2O95_07545, partial [Clostridia bacterium]|nr:hypothetical protein [Clostridia bacterium]